jgi:phage tail-like protein
VDDDTNTTSRRRFLGAAAGATGVALAATVWNGTPAQAGERSYVSGSFFFNLDGVKTGFIKSIDGGAISADVITEAVGTSSFAKKHIGTPKYEDFALQIGFSMSKAVYDWIAASWQMNYQRKNGSIVAADFAHDAKAEREFFNALITETGIPACDAGSKDPSFLTVKFAPEFVRTKPASGKIQFETSKDAQQKLWLPQNFKLEIDGLDCTRVNKVDAFTVKQSVSTDSIGGARDYLKEPGALEFPNLKVTLPVSAGQTWFDWFSDFVVSGNNGEDNEKSGRLVFLSPNRQTELLEIKFFNLGIFKLTDDTWRSTDDQIARLTAELYCERMEFRVGPPVIG